ncbi:MAG: histidine kinase [Bacteroidota bacterium]
MRTRLTTLSIHLGVWSLFLLLPGILLLYLGNTQRLFAAPWLIVLPLVSVLSFAFLFYLNYYVLLPQVFEQRGRAAYLLVSVLALMVVFGGQLFFRQWLLTDTVRPTDLPLTAFRRLGLFLLLLLHLLTWGVSSGLWLLRAWKKAAQRLEESEYQRAQAELDQLKKQIQPHFLFNTLNSIYALSLLRGKAAAPAILQLSKLMRYTLTEAKRDTVALAVDLEYLTHYVDLNRLRLTDAYPLSFNASVHPAGYGIAPFLLLPFVENAFQYGVSQVNPKPIDIQISRSDQELEFYCRNTINHFAVAEAENTGIGLENTARRLDLLYPERHTLTVTDDGLHFTVRLRIALEPIHELQTITGV